MKDPRESTIHWMCFKHEVASPFGRGNEHVTAGFYIDGFRASVVATPALLLRIDGHKDEEDYVARQILRQVFDEVAKGILKKGFAKDLLKAAKEPAVELGARHLYPSGCFDYHDATYYQALELENERLKKENERMEKEIALLQCSLSEEISMEMEEEWRH